MYNQRDYPKIPYPAKGYEGATVATSGCGPVCMSMIVENMTGADFPPKTSAPYAIKAGARVSGGTDMRLLSSCIARDFGLKYSVSNDRAELVKAVQNGGMAIVNVAGGSKGVFSDSGHYIVVAGVSGDELVIADPYMYAGKFDKPWRKAVRVAGELCYCPAEVVHADAEGRNPRYYIFEP